MLTKTNSCAMRTQSIGKILSSTHGSNLWWCPPTAVSHVSNPNGTNEENDKKNNWKSQKRHLKYMDIQESPTKT